LRDNTQIYKYFEPSRSGIRCAHIAKSDLSRTFHFDEVLLCACFCLCKVYNNIANNVDTLLNNDTSFSSSKSHNIRDSLRNSSLSIQYSFIKDTSPKLHVTFFSHLYIHSVIYYRGIIRISKLN